MAWRGWCVVVLALLTLSVRSAVDLNVVNDGTFEVEFQPAGALAKSTDNVEIPADRWTVMTAANGTKYDCSISLPPLLSAEDLRAAQEKLLNTRVAPKIRQRIHDLLEGTCTMLPMGWWVYEVCWGKQARQYHMRDDKELEAEYFIGKGPAHKIDKGATNELDWGESPVHGMYVSTRFLNGTVCDLTGDSRESEIRVGCLETDHTDAPPMALVEVQEVGSCKYVITMKSAKLCEIPELRKELKPAQKITCYARD
jgi:protein OS-9